FFVRGVARIFLLAFGVDNSPIFFLSYRSSLPNAFTVRPALKSRRRLIPDEKTSELRRSARSCPAPTGRPTYLSPTRGGLRENSAMRLYDRRTLTTLSTMRFAGAAYRSLSADASHQDPARLLWTPP